MRWLVALLLATVAASSDMVQGRAVSSLAWRVMAEPSFILSVTGT